MLSAGNGAPLFSTKLRIASSLCVGSTLGEDDERTFLHV